MGASEAEGRDAAPTAVVDSQWVKTTERGFDAAKKIKGRKRHVAVDTLGLPIACQITPADTRDRDALAPVLREVRRKSRFVTMSCTQRKANQGRASSCCPSVRLDQPSHRPRQRLRSDNRVLARVAPHHFRLPAHATPRQPLTSTNQLRALRLTHRASFQPNNEGRRCRPRRPATSGALPRSW